MFKKILFSAFAGTIFRGKSLISGFSLGRTLQPIPMVNSKSKVLLLLLTGVFLIFCVSSLHAQVNNKCGNTEANKVAMEQNPEIKLQRELLESQIQEYLKSKDFANSKQAAVDYVIPIVVHVIHLGEAVGTGINISDTQIEDCVLGLNERFANENGLGVNTHIQFCLASTDPNGNPTNGINRVDGTSLNGYATYGLALPGGNCTQAPSETFVKALSRWPSSDYYNVWVVSQICPPAGGYAYFPGTTTAGLDGSVLIKDAFFYVNYSMAHETGHYLNLHHTFEGDDPNYDGIYTCPLNLYGCGYNSGDCCDDTPIHKTTDVDSINPCTTSGIWSNSRYNNMAYNFANYVDTLRFTQDQTDRMVAALAISPRSSLLNSNGCQFVGVEENIKAKTTLALHPNPSGSIVKIQTNAKELYLTDLTGKILYSTVVHSGETNLDVSGLPAGVFFIHTSEGRAEKLIVQH